MLHVAIFYSQRVPVSRDAKCFTISKNENELGNHSFLFKFPGTHKIATAQEILGCFFKHSSSHINTLFGPFTSQLKYQRSDESLLMDEVPQKFIF